SNVMAEAGLANILRWVPFPVNELDLRNRIKNKMIRPTSIPQTLEDLVVEQAICREALRLSFVQHRTLAVGLKGKQQSRDISDALTQSATGESLVNLLDLGLVVGSGGVLSHAPRRAQALLMMLDAFLPEGVTEVAVDSIFMTPQLGVLSTVHEQAATEVFERDCLIVLGACVAPIGAGKPGQPCMTVEVRTAAGAVSTHRAACGDMMLVPGAGHERWTLTVTPERGFDVGAGRGKPLTRDVRAGEVGLVLDARGRQPFALPSDDAARIDRLRAWNRALAIYPREL
ncbi:MAG: glutamate mutase L, partial [Candidatus Eisenbacteria bacterium]|nr:glutamate mutase L [Candidatus Eisenbacteria bacterium]